MSLLKDKIELEVELAELKAKRELDQFPRALKWVLILSLAGIVPGYFAAKSVSYRAWSRNYSQYLITPKSSFENPKAPSHTPVTLTSAGTGSFSAVVKVNNENIDLAASNARYEFIFYNEKKETVYRESGSTFLLPGEEKYLIVPRIATKERITAADFRWLEEIRWGKRIRIYKVQLRAPAPSTYNQFIPQAFVADGNFTNDSSYQLGAVRLTFVIFDKAGNIVGASRRDEFTVAPHERRGYKQLWPNMSGDPSFTVKVYAETNVLDKQNLTLPEAAASPASSLERPPSKQ